MEINIPGYGPLPFIDTNPRNFFRRTTIMYGPSETGKTFVCNWLMDILQPFIPNVIIINPTNASNEAYKDRVPARCIKSTVDVKELKDIYDRQVNATFIYNKANNMDTLQKLFTKINDFTAVNTVDKIKKLSQKKLESLDKNYQIDFAQKTEQMQAITSQMNKAIKRIYKSTIRSYKDRLTMVLSEDERYAIKYIDFNPSLLLVLDDVQSEIEKWGKDPTINKLFFEARHNWVTSFYLLQSDSGKNGLPPGIRLNTFNNIFTDPNVMSHFFKNDQNGFTLAQKKQAQIIAAELFKANPNGVENYKKFVYSRLDKVAKFRYLIAEKPVNPRFGCDALWELCDVQGEKQISNDKFTKSFAI